MSENLVDEFMKQSIETRQIILTRLGLTVDILQKERDVGFNKGVQWAIEKLRNKETFSETYPERRTCRAWGNWLKSEFKSMTEKEEEKRDE